MEAEISRYDVKKGRESGLFEIRFLKGYSYGLAVKLFDIADHLSLVPAVFEPAAELFGFIFRDGYQKPARGLGVVKTVGNL